MPAPSKSSSTTSAKRRRLPAVEGWPPRWLTPVSAADRKRGDGALYADFAEAVCRITKDSFGGPVGQLLKYSGWQREVLSHVFARRPDGRLKHRQALIGEARKNAKSTQGAGIALGGLVLGPDGGEVYSCAGDREQAKVVFGTAKRMVELDPELSELLKVYRDVIEYPATGSIYKALSAEAYTKEGLNPHLVLFDEVHVQPNRELWDVMALAMGARLEPLLLGITTAGVRTDQTGGDSLCYSMYQYGCKVASGEIIDPAFFMAWWEPRNPKANYRDPAVHKEANPGYGTLIDPEDFASSVLKTPENEFRTKRLNQWVSSSQAWLPAGTWDDCADPTDGIADGERVVLGFDGSRSGDATAIVAVAIGDTEVVPYVQVVGLWERPADAPPGWQVPRFEVLEAIREACQRWDVIEIAVDMYLWQMEMTDLELAGFPILQIDQTPARMVPATQRFYEAVVGGNLAHDGDPRLARHIANAVLRTSSRGAQLAKEHKMSPRKIDLAVATVMAFDVASDHEHPVDVAGNVW